MNRVSLLLTILFLMISFVPVHAQWQQVGRCGVVNSLCVNDTFLFAATGRGIYRSADNGGHWIKIDPVLPVWDYDPMPRFVLADGNKLYASFNGQADYLSKIFVSTDNGENWDANLNMPTGGGPGTIAVSGNWIITGPLNMQSTDSGRNWTYPSVGGIATGLFTVAMKDSTAIALTSTGLNRTSDQGKTWKTIYSFDFPGPPSGSSILFSDSTVYAGFFDHIMLSTDRGGGGKTVLLCPVDRLILLL